MFETIADFFKSVGMGNVALWIIVISCFIEITPIKFNPLGFIAKKIGDQFNHSVNKQIETVREDLVKRIDELRDEQNEKIGEIYNEINTLSAQQQELKTKQIEQMAKINDNEIRRLRHEIIEFSTSIVNLEKHPIEEYVHIIECYGDYHKLIEENGLTNGRIDKEYEIILSHYHSGREMGLDRF